MTAKYFLVGSHYYEDSEDYDMFNDMISNNVISIGWAKEIDMSDFYSKSDEVISKYLKDNRVGIKQYTTFFEDNDMKGLLIRVGIDSTCGNWNSPVNPVSREFVYVPIPEEENVKPTVPEYETNYIQFYDACKKMGQDLPHELLNVNAHLDPDFKHLSYGDQANRGRPLWSLERGDIIAFYAGMKPVFPCGQKTLYALIGLYEIDYVISANMVPEKDWVKNAHTRREITPNDVVVLGKEETSGRLEKCIPIGEYRDGAYRVTKELLTTWGGLSVNDGWIQRSAVLPHFKDAERFYSWFKEQNINMITENN